MTSPRVVFEVVPPAEQVNPENPLTKAHAGEVTPVTHVVQTADCDAAATSLYMPTMHAVQTAEVEAAAKSPYVPGVHSVQEREVVEPSKVLYLPAAHALHADTPSSGE